MMIIIENSIENDFCKQITRLIDELASTYYQKGDWTAAEQCYKEAIKR